MMTMKFKEKLQSRPRWILAVAACGFLCLSVSEALAQDWAKAMFKETSHDFGTVARGAKVEHRFVVENLYEEDAHIRSLSSSCGCSTPTVAKRLLKTWEKTEVVVMLDTRGFLGRKDATIEVDFDRPFEAKVQLHVHAFIRGDIVVQPGAVQFGVVPEGMGAQQTLAVNYAGRNDWKIERVECANPHIDASAVETSRKPGLVGYNVVVHLKPDAPSGYIQDQLVLVTNDFNQHTARVPVAIEGVVRSPVTVRPSPLMMGFVQAGKSVTRNLVVQGQAPFRIVSARSADQRFQCKVPVDARTVHILPVRFLAGDAAEHGKLDAKILIETDLVGSKLIEVGACVQVIPAAKP